MSRWRVLLALSVCAGTAQAEKEVLVQGAGVARMLTIEEGQLRSAYIVNDAAGRTVRTVGPEFLLTWGDGAAVTSDAFRVLALDPTDQGAVAVLENTGLGIRAEITYSRAEKGPWLYKVIRFSNMGAAPFLLRTVEVEHLTVTDEAMTYSVDPKFPLLSDWGQPVYTESLWFGVEFPAVRAAATTGGTIFLRHHPGVELAPNQTYITKRAVLGAAAAGSVKQAFMNYVATITPRPNPPDPHNYWNGFRVIKPPNRTEQGLKMVEYAKKLKEETGYTFDAWTYDAGFDLYRADALFVPNEPDIWRDTAEALKPLGIPLGMWTSFSCIFDTPTHAWGQTQGYELQHKASYCLAGPAYYAAIKARLEELVTTYHMNSINFDGMYLGQGFGCNESGHGHLVGQGAEAGVYATERVVENKMAIFQSLRKINPGIILDLFVCNEWASPWWLMQLDGVHTVAGDTLGCDIPSPWLRDELITVRDIQVFDEHRRLKRQFPLWAEDLYGTQVRSDHLIDGVTVTGESMAARWEDEYVMAYPGRGAISNHIVCCDLGVLDQSRGGLRFLGEVGKWVDAHAAFYRDFHLIGGEPARRQPYGYGHGDGQGRCIVALRNPWIEPRLFALRLDAEIGLTPVNEPLSVNVIYPYKKRFSPQPFGATLEIPLQDYQVLLLKIVPVSQEPDGIRDGARWFLEEGGTGLRQWDDSAARQLPSGRLHAAVQPGKVRISGRVSIPEKAKSQLQVMMLPGQAPSERPVVHIDGRSADFAFHKRVFDSGGANAWAVIDVAEGEHTVEVDIPGHGEIQVGAWLIAVYDLSNCPHSSRNAAVVHDQFPAPEAREDRRVAALLPPIAVTLPLAPLPEGQSLFLSDLPARAVEAKSGFGAFGWNQSGWPQDQELRIGNTPFEKGMGLHAPAVATFEIEGVYARFSAKVGLLGIPAERKTDKTRIGSCIFVVEGDAKELFRSQVRREGDEPLPIEADIRGVKRLTLRTEDAGDSHWDDLATWGDAQVHR